MRKNLSVQPALFPIPVTVAATYDENGVVCVLNAARVQICENDKIALFINDNHKTTANIIHTKAFTVSIADFPNMKAADFLGIATGNKMSDKFKRTGYHAVKSEFVNAPIITEFYVISECELTEIVNTKNFHAFVGKIINVGTDEKVIGYKDKIDPIKMNALVFDQFQSVYYVIGEKVGQA
ncbi:MAG: flavin reductase [Ruminococcus sp.]|nr:flavin reductase [Ruminococcus sp.]